MNYKFAVVISTMDLMVYDAVQLGLEAFKEEDSYIFICDQYRFE